VVSSGQLRDARPGLWQQAANDWSTAAKHAASCADAIRNRGKGPLDQHWADRVGAMAGKELTELANWFEAASDEMLGVVMILDGLAESTELARALSVLRSHTRSDRYCGTGEGAAILTFPDSFV
jgi:hypothetical protein